MQERQCRTEEFDVEKVKEVKDVKEKKKNRNLPKILARSIETGTACRAPTTS
jgi:hypothetical protein